MKQKQGVYRFKREDVGNYTLRAVFGDEKTEGAFVRAEVTLYKCSYEKEYKYCLTRLKPECHLVISDGDLLSVRDSEFELEKEE